ncbi:MAG: adenylate kinase family protein [Nitrososphaerota archaeon]|nr:adenylate kinase family protein [Candidatus Bathyarchaeota archaeon]MDW8022795.1 adenylate kinase family protein [Nitrososphaerota archaeon]
MARHVVLVTGTPCVGKTSVARLLSLKLNAVYVNLTDLAVGESLILGKDGKRGSLIVDEGGMQSKLEEIIKESGGKSVVVDGHYAPRVVPEHFTTHVFVLRRDPVELRKLMEKAGFSGRKLWENLASEILDVCLVDALSVYGEDKVCELDVSGKTVEEVVSEILKVLEGSGRCRVGVVDWLGKLESEGLLDDFLKI